MKKVCFLLLLFSLLWGSCVTGSYGLAREVRLGMTEAQVIHLLGAPQARGLLRQFSFDSERLKALSIIAPNLSLNYDKVLLIDTLTSSSNAAAARTLLEALH